jgi:hypothetical protein
MAQTTVTLKVSEFPGVIAGLRRAIAERLRSEADGEPEFVASKLRKIAADFEAGQ